MPPDCGERTDGSDIRYFFKVFQARHAFYLYIGPVQGLHHSHPVHGQRIGSKARQYSQKKPRTKIRSENVCLTMKKKPIHTGLFKAFGDAY